jgi:hypothetical protein
MEPFKFDGFVEQSNKKVGPESIVNRAGKFFVDFGE